MLPQLEALYKKWQNAGLVVIGINFDEKAGVAQKRCKSLGITFSQIWVPNDEKTRELWSEASGVGALPRVFLIDHAGVLRSDSVHDFDKIEKMVGELLKKAEKKK
jgi:hypothetical protein